MKIGIVIQGQILSFGSVGGLNTIRQGFDASEITITNFENAKRHGFLPLVVTWKPKTFEEKKVIRKLKSKKIKILLKDSPTYFDPDHRYKQRHAFLFGISELEKQNQLDFVFKIRTDMLMPDEFWIWLAKIVKDKKTKNKFFSSELIIEDPFYLGDFLQGGEKDLVVSMLDSYLNKRKYYFPSSVADFGIHFYSQITNSFFFRKMGIVKKYFLFIFYHDDLIRLWQATVEKRIQVLPKDIWLKIKWRKRYIFEIFPPHSFNFAFTSNTNPKLNTSVIALSYDLWRRKIRRYQRLKSNKIHVAFFNSINFIFFSGKGLWTKIDRYFNLSNQKIILGRVSCIGKDILKLEEKDYLLKNQQKSRVDNFYASIIGKNKPQYNLIEPYIGREDIKPLIKEQCDLPWLKVNTQNIKYILMDTYSELTDKKFTHKKEGWSFSCHYADLDKSKRKEFEKIFADEGLLPLKQLEKSYEQFFTWCKKEYSDIPIYVVVASSALDSKKEYKKRALEIKRVLKKLAKKNKQLRIITIPESQINPGDDSLPYHYSPLSLFEYKEKWASMKL